MCDIFDNCATVKKVVRQFFELLNIYIGSFWLVSYKYLLKLSNDQEWTNKTFNSLGYMIRLKAHMGTFQNKYDTWGAFRRNTVRQDGRIQTESYASFGKIVRQFPQSHM